jgi:hypothetical protein
MPLFPLPRAKSRLFVPQASLLQKNLHFSQKGLLFAPHYGILF